MCGIFGVINSKEKIDEGRVIAARDIIAHRGPDDLGIFISPDKTTALAHRRLSILDLSSAAHQPMTTDDRYTIVFNGEIYNYQELKKRLTTHISQVKSSSDTEVLLDLYADYGSDCISMLRGMFAFAIWDDKEKTLFAARDRFGIKPFYFLNNGNEFIFSSELKAIKYYKDNLTPSMEGIDAFLRTGSIPAPLTIYNEVSSLLPGHLLEIDCHPERSLPAVAGRRISIKNYWSFNDLFEESYKSSIENSKLNIKNSKLVYDTDAKKKIRAALLDSVQAHMVSDVEVGAFLSGGIDSTAIVSLMRQVGQEKIKTINISFPESKLDEAKYARKASDFYNTSNYEYNLTEHDVIAELDNIFFSMEQPTIDGINTYFVSKAARDLGLDVVLSGVGGDELFGGYPSFRNIPKLKKIMGLPLAQFALKSSLPLIKNRLPAKAIEYFKNPMQPDSEYKLFRGLFTNAELKSLGWNFESETTNVKRQMNTMNGSSSAQSALPCALSDLQYVSMMESTHYMRNQLLRDSDVFSMAHSLELRVPFVDHILYNNVLPYLDSGFDKIHPKKMLIDAVGDLPREITHRPKMGFTFPFEEWVKRGFLKEVIFENLDEIKSVLGINYQDINFESLHWSRLWALFVLSRFV